MSDEEEVAFREMFPLVIGALVGITLLLIIVAQVLDFGSRDDVYVPAGQTRTDVLVDRLAPIGQVQFGGPEEVAAADDEPDADPRSGGEVYQAVCAACHDSGAAGSPLLDDTDEWSDRLADRGFDGLVESVINGLGAMPARGGGGDRVSDEELEKSVEYILEENDISW